MIYSIIHNYINACGMQRLAARIQFHDNSTKRATNKSEEAAERKFGVLEIVLKEIRYL